MSKTVRRLSLGMLVAIGTVEAGSIGPDCGSCFGAVYSLTSELKSSGALTETREFTYTIDSSGYDGPALGKYITAVAAQISSQIVIPLAVSTNFGGVWVPLSGVSLNDVGCAAGGGAGWICLQGALSGAPVGSSTPASWKFTVAMAKDSLLDTARIQANYDPTLKVMMSESVSMPEGIAMELPLTMAGIGLWFLWRKHARRFN